MLYPLHTIKNHPNDMPENIQQWMSLLTKEISKERQLLNYDTQVNHHGITLIVQKNQLF